MTETLFRNTYNIEILPALGHFNYASYTYVCVSELVNKTFFFYNYHINIISA